MNFIANLREENVKLKRQVMEKETTIKKLRENLETARLYMSERAKLHGEHSKLDNTIERFKMVHSYSDSKPGPIKVSPGPGIISGR